MYDERAHSVESAFTMSPKRLAKKCGGEIVSLITILVLLKKKKKEITALYEKDNNLLANDAAHSNCVRLD